MKPKLKCPYHEETYKQPKIIQVEKIIEGENQYQYHYLKAYYECQDCQQIFVVKWFDNAIKEGMFI